MNDTYERSRIGMLWYITQFCLSMKYDSLSRAEPGLHWFQSDLDHTRVQVGDLIVMTATPINKWYLSWVIEIEKGSNQYQNNYLCQSIETGKLIWWRNVGMQFMDREVVKENPQWRWTDRQFAFNDRWNKVAKKEYFHGGTFSIMATRPKFGDGFEVTMAVHQYYGGDFKPSKTFPDWRKFTKAMMSEFYNECVAKKKEEKKRELSV